MKTKSYWFALLASAALIAQAQAGGHHGGGGFAGSGGGHISSHAGGPSFHSAAHANFGGGARFAAPGPRFSAMGGRFSSNTFRQHYINGGAAIGARQFTPGYFDRGSYVTRFESRGNRFGQIAYSTGERTGAIRNYGGQARNGNNLPANWRNHIAGQRSADWHRDWDRHRDHFWRGHRCRFVNGEWFIFDFGFPWDSYGYPYDYYADDYYPSQYDPGVYEGDDGDYYGQDAYESQDQSIGPTIAAAAQEQLERRRYYRGEIDGIVGPETRRAIMRYQSDRGLRVTGSLTTDTLHALGLPRVANN
jgi:Putative peptidoglycan binding domain